MFRARIPKKKTEISDHGVSIPLRILTSSMLPSCLRRIALLLTLLSVLLYFLYCVLDLYMNCDVVVSIDSLFRLTVSNFPNAVNCLFSSSGCKWMRACV